ncbi:MAG: hypothetical protein HOG49_00070 [Candidatus Scalindua sp.]|jgi:hypothetical protein|nr:hypothetical protein [Candidatus Scalindua sp.]
MLNTSALVAFLKYVIIFQVVAFASILFYKFGNVIDIVHHFMTFTLFTITEFILLLVVLSFLSIILPFTMITMERMLTKRVN